LISLTPSFVSGAELLLLLTHYITAAIDPFGSLLTSLARAISYIVLAFLGAGAQHFSRLVARTRCVKGSHHSAYAQSSQKPHKAITVTV
jgi:hypothetical protein